MASWLNGSGDLWDITAQPNRGASAKLPQQTPKLFSSTAPAEFQPSVGGSQTQQDNKHCQGWLKSPSGLVRRRRVQAGLLMLVPLLPLVPRSMLCWAEMPQGKGASIATAYAISLPTAKVPASPVFQNLLQNPPLFLFVTPLVGLDSPTDGPRPSTQAKFLTHGKGQTHSRAWHFPSA